MDLNELRASVDRAIGEWVNPGEGSELEPVSSVVDRVMNLVEVHTGTHSKFIRIRGTLGRLTRDMGDSEKLIKTEVSIYNTPNNLMAFAMLGSAAVDIVGVQADLEARREGVVKCDAFDEAQTDLEDFCADAVAVETLEAELAALLPDETAVADFADWADYEEWCLDEGLALNPDEARMQGAYACAEAGLIEDTNPYDETRLPVLRAAWAEGHAEAKRIRNAIDAAQCDVGVAQKYAPDAPEEFPDENDAPRVPAISPWAKKTAAELKAEVERRGLELPRACKKADLVALLEESIDAAEDGVPGDDEVSRARTKKAVNA